jgi:CHAD domain-containing protein
MQREAKFEGPGVFDPDTLRGLPGVAKVREEQAEELDALYYDSVDLHLLAHGITLRRRSGGHGEGWHVELPAYGGDRREIHAPRPAGRGGAVPPELRRHLKAYLRGRDLVPVVHMRTHRRRHLLLDARGRSLAEVAQDRVSAQVLGTERLTAAGPGPPTDDAGTSTVLTRWSEIQIERDQGGGKLMRAAARLLAAEGWHPSPSVRTVDHALAAGLPSGFASPGPVRRPPAGSAGEAVMNRLEEQLGVLLSCDAAVRADEPDAVHTMRSTSRRLRSLLRSHGRVLDRRRTDPVADELRWLTRALGDSRDHEVLAARLSEQARALSDPADKDLALRIGGQERRRHQRAQEAAVAALDSLRYYALLDALESFQQDPPLRGGRSRQPAVAHLRKVAARDRRRLTQRMAAAGAAEPGPAREEAMHEARKAARRARHTAECALPYGGTKADRLRKRTRDVQQVLGDHQDAVMARRALPELAAQAHASGADTFGYGRLHARQEELARQARDDLGRAWRRARRRSLVRFP